MGIALGGHTVGGPAGVAHGTGGRGDAFFGSQFFFQRGKLARGAHHMQVALTGKGHASRVVPAILQTAQAFNHNGNSRPVTRITDNAAHKVPPFMPGKARSQTTLVAL